MKPKIRRSKGFIVSVGLAVFFLLFSSSAQLHAKKINYKGKEFDIAEPGEFIPNQIVVVEKKLDKVQRAVYDLAYEVGAQILHENRSIRMYLFEFLDETSTKEALNIIASKKNKSYIVFRNWKNSVPRPPINLNKKAVLEKSDRTIIQHWTNDPAFRSQWWLWKIKEPWAGIPTTGSVKNIAIIDTGVDYSHSDLAGKVKSGFDYVDWDMDPMDEHGHGTHCAGIAAAISDNNIGIHGVSPESDIWAYRAFNRYGSGGSYQIWAAITDAADNPDVDIISCSFSGWYLFGSPSYDTYQNVIDYARFTKQKIVCAAAGNDSNATLYQQVYYGMDYVPCPASIPSSFTVGATQIEDHLAEFSNSDVLNLNSGDGTANYDWDFVDIVAPGEDILSTLPGEKYDAWDGTSMSTPMVAGACARVWSKFSTKLPWEIQSLLVTTGKTVHRTEGFHRAEKRLDLMKAMGGSITGIQGQIINGEMGYPVNGAKVEVKMGGVLVKTTYTNSAGIWTATGLNPSTIYTILITKPGFVARWAWIGAPGTSGEIRDLNSPIPLVPSRPITTTYENWRIVVYWPSTSPGFYDYYYGYVLGYSTSWWPYEWFKSAGMEANSYLETPSDTISYSNPGLLGTDPYVRFMHDSYWDTKAPFESFVIQDQETGDYKFWVSCDAPEWCWGQLRFGTTPNPPTVYVYKGDTLMEIVQCRLAIRDGWSRKYWNVFVLNGDTITVINTITDTWPGT